MYVCTCVYVCVRAQWCWGITSAVCYRVWHPLSERYNISSDQVSHTVKSVGVSPLVCSNPPPPSICPQKPPSASEQRTRPWLTALGRLNTLKNTVLGKNTALTQYLRLCGIFSAFSVCLCLCVFVKERRGWGWGLGVGGGCTGSLRKITGLKKRAVIPFSLSPNPCTSLHQCLFVDVQTFPLGCNPAWTGDMTSREIPLRVVLWAMILLSISQTQTYIHTGTHKCTQMFTSASPGASFSRGKGFCVLPSP